MYMDALRGWRDSAAAAASGIASGARAAAGAATRAVTGASGSGRSRAPAKAARPADLRMYPNGPMLHLHRIRTGENAMVDKYGGDLFAANEPTARLTGLPRSHEVLVDMGVRHPIPPRDRPTNLFVDKDRFMKDAGLGVTLGPGRQLVDGRGKVVAVHDALSHPQRLGLQKKMKELRAQRKEAEEEEEERQKQVNEAALKQETCPICLDKLEQPHLLPCQHLLCSECLDCMRGHGASATAAAHACPLCRAPIGGGRRTRRRQRARRTRRRRRKTARRGRRRTGRRRR